MNEDVKAESRPTDTLMICCPVCDSDSGDTLGVTGEMGRSLVSTVIMRCDVCRTVYLSPPPTTGGGKERSDSDAVQLYSRVIKRQNQGIPANCRFFCFDVNEESILQGSPEANQFDLVLLPLALEGSADPGALLVHVARLLDRNGEIDVLVSNTDSNCFRIFCGRHWYGYRFPAARQLFDVSGIERLAIKAGLRIKSTRTLLAANGWLLSTRNWLVDWQVRPAIVTLLTGRWIVPWLVASFFESISALRGKTAVLVVRLEKR